MKNAILAISERKETLKQIRKELSEQYEIITFNNLLDALDMLRESDFDIILLDEYLTWFNFAEAKRKLSGLGKDFVIVGLLEDETETAIQELKNADIYNYLMKPVELKEMNRIILPALKNLEMLKEKRKLEEKLASLEEESEIVGQSSRIKDVKNLVEKVAESDLAVLITGENGLGKEIVAREIYKKSDRRKNNYIVVSCASIPEEMMERELFGYERGAFTGANSSKKGLLEEADGGTIFLDDISAMDIKCQAKLLKVIEYGELKRVGGNKTRRVDVRFIASSNKDLKDETEKVFFKNTYSRKKIPLIINKTVEGNMSEKRKEFAFSITLKDANGTAYELSDEEIKDVGFSTKGEDQKGVYTFTLKDGESKEFSLPYGCKYTISEEDYSSSGYKTYIGEKKEENQKRTTEEETLTQKTEINFLNKKEVIPPTGVETTMTVWLLMTGVTFLLGAVFLLFGIRRKRFVA